MNHKKILATAVLAGAGMLSLAGCQLGSLFGSGQVVACPSGAAQGSAQCTTTDVSVGPPPAGSASSTPAVAPDPAATTPAPAPDQAPPSSYGNSYDPSGNASGGPVTSITTGGHWHHNRNRGNGGESS